MAFTQAQLDSLREAYASGILTVKHGDKIVTYRSLDDMARLISQIEKALAGTSRKSCVVGCYRKY